MPLVIVDFAVAAEHPGLAVATPDIEALIAQALPGNSSYSVWTCPDHPGKLRPMHEWTDAPSFNGYKATAAFKSAGAVLFPLMIDKSSSRAFQVFETG